GRRFGEAGPGPHPRPLVRQPAGASRHVHRWLRRRPDPEPGDARPHPRWDRQMSKDFARPTRNPAAPGVADEEAAGPEIRPTNEMSAGERLRLIESMRPEDAETVPELHEVDVPDELRERIEAAMSKYPEIRSAALPALWAVQHHYGWCTREGLRQAAAVMGVTPGYLESLATFYDLFRTSPVGRHQVLVCHNISCWLRGGDDLLSAFCEAAGADAHGADHGGGSSPDAGRVV